MKKLSRELRSNFISSDSEGCLTVKLLPLISFISNSKKQSFSCWLLGGLIFVFSSPKNLFFQFSFLKLDLQIEDF